jgi:assimilatory nitrate reductase catalytic subunit
MPFDAGEPGLPAGVRTTCPYCGVGCGLVVEPGEDGRYRVRGDRSHPANLGRVCSKGAALGETVGLEGRLLHPVVDGVQTGWDRALDAVAGRFRAVIDAHGPDAVAFYVSGQLLTEDYYVANKLMKGFIGSANIDTNSRLCMASAVAAYKRAFGSDSVPNSYEDLEQADLVVLVGSNLAWCHPVLYQRIQAARRARPGLRLVVIDPRHTASCEGADLHLALRPGSDALLFCGLLNWLAQQGHVDHDYVAAHTSGFDEALAQAGWYAPSVDAAAAACALAPADVKRFFDWFAGTPRVVTMFSQGVNQSSSGTDKGNAIINCHLATGRIGRPGAGPFSITGQPNAMGGREVGGLANQLAAHMELENPEHRALVQRFWQAPRVASSSGLKAVDLFRAVERGEVKALWIMATNPVVSLPDNNQVRRALERCECVVVSDCIADTDTVRHAHVRLPALAWGEKDGTVTNSERRISRQRAFLQPPGEARADWWIVCEVARRMGFAGFDYADAAAVFDEHARLSGFDNDGRRDFDISGLVGLGSAGYAALEPVQWPVRGNGGTPRLFADGRFFTPDGRARMLPVVPRPPAGHPDQAYPLLLNTGRVRDQWHTMTRTGRAPRLSLHIAEPFVAMHPDDASACGLGDGGLATVISPRGEALLRVRLDNGQARGQVFAPIHWNDQTAAAARIGSLVAAHVDPVSGQPEFKQTAVRVVPYAVRWQGFLLSRDSLAAPLPGYWARIRRQECWQYEIAGDGQAPDWSDWVREISGDGRADDQWVELSDSAGLDYRAARIRAGRLDSVFMVSAQGSLPPRDWLLGLFAHAVLERDDRMHLLRGGPPGARRDAGPVTCACFGVTRDALLEAITQQGLDTPEAIGRALSAGTNCGSCVPEIRALIEAASEFAAN